MEIFSTNPDLYPIKRVDGLNKISHIITVTIETGQLFDVLDKVFYSPFVVEVSFNFGFISSGIDQYQEVAVEIIKCDFHKPFLGGFRHKITGVEFHNAGTQTVPKKISGKSNVFCRDTQVVFLFFHLGL